MSKIFYLSSRKIFTVPAACMLFFALVSCRIIDNSDTETTVSLPGTPSISSTEAVTTSSIKITWSAASNAAGYYVYTGSSEDGTYTKTNTISTTSTLYATVSSISGTSLSAGTTYYFKISAYNSAGEGAKSAAVSGTTVASSSTVPGAPGNVSASAESSSSITVTWDTVSTANGYYVYYSTDSSSFSSYETVSGNSAVSDIITGLTAATTYYFAVSAYNDNGEGAKSSTANAETDESASRDITDTATDEIDNNTFVNTVYINLSVPSFSTTGSGDSGTAITEAEADVGSTGITIALSDGVISVDAADVTGMTNYILTGSLSGSFAVTGSAKNLAITLNNAEISSGNYPPIEVGQKKKTTFIVLPSGTTNTLTDGRTYGCGYGADYESTSASYVEDGDDTAGSLAAKGPMIITDDTSGGSGGSLTITTAYKHCIYSKDYIRMFGGTITTSNSGRNAVECVNGFIMEDGTLALTGTGTNTNNQSRGIVVKGEESDDYQGEGFILINDGVITINTVSKAMTAKWDIDDDAETTSVSDDPDPYVEINGGTISITTTGTPADDSSGTYTFTDADGVSTTETTSLSPEGIEGKRAVYINGGSITLTTTDDGINASLDDSGEIVITGGTIYAFSKDNDAIDSNGTLTITGGTIVAITTTNPECAFDCDDNTFTITGGLLVGMGTSNYSAPTSSACTKQGVIVLDSDNAPAGKTMAICSGTTTPIFAFTVPSLSSVASTGGSSTYDVLLLSSPDIAKGTTYTVRSGVTASGDTFHGLYTGNISLSAEGTSAETFTLSSSYVYTDSSVSNSGAQEGTHPNGGR